MTLFQAFGQFAGAGAAVPVDPYGWTVIVPSSISVTGAGSESATITANGGIDYSNVATLDLNGIFTAQYDHYWFWIEGTCGANAGLRLQARNAGSTDTGNNYAIQTSVASSTSITGARSDPSAAFAIGNTGTNRFGYSVYVFNPFSSTVNTTTRSTGIRYTGSTIATYEYAAIYSTLTGHDGITLSPGSSDVTGTLTVLGGNS